MFYIFPRFHAFTGVVVICPVDLNAATFFVIITMLLYRPTHACHTAGTGTATHWATRSAPHRSLVSGVQTRVISGTPHNSKRNIPTTPNNRRITQKNVRSEPRASVNLRTLGNATVGRARTRTFLRRHRSNMIVNRLTHRIQQRPVHHGYVRRRTLFTLVRRRGQLKHRVNRHRLLLYHRQVHNQRRYRRLIIVSRTLLRPHNGSTHHGTGIGRSVIRPLNITHMVALLRNGIRTQIRNSGITSCTQRRNATRINGHHGTGVDQKRPRRLLTLTLRLNLNDCSLSRVQRVLLTVTHGQRALFSTLSGHNARLTFGHLSNLTRHALHVTRLIHHTLGASTISRRAGSLVPQYRYTSASVRPWGILPKLFLPALTFLGRARSAFTLLRPRLKTRSFLQGHSMAGKIP